MCYTNGHTVKLASREDGDTHTPLVALAPYTIVRTGEIQGGTRATQLPNLSCGLVKLKARSDNVGGVYVGGPGVTVGTGETNRAAGFELSPGESIELPVDNLNHLHLICDNSGDSLSYLALG